MIRTMRVSVLLVCVVCCYGQSNVPADNATSLHNGLTEKIGNFSVELLYHAATLQPEGQNMIMSPFTVWTTLAVISEGASGRTEYQINYALRIPTKSQDHKTTRLNLGLSLVDTRLNFVEISKWLQVNTSTVELAKFNAMFVDRQKLLNEEFRERVKKFYQMDSVSLNFTDTEYAANSLNTVISNFTHGRINKIVDSSYFKDASMVLTSAVYFKGQWTVPFNKSNTMKQPFYDSNGKQIGEVNMMYNRHNYPFSNIKALQARVIELPYGKENRLSMIIMLPNPGVPLETMFKNFNNVTLDSLFEELRVSREEYAEDEVDCFIPRFKIESDIDLTSVLSTRMGINDLFDVSKARLEYMARTPLYVSKAVHKAEIEVTEDGTTASAVTVVEFSNRIGVVRFEANRPFTYMIIEKITNSIVFGGFYKQPSLY